MLCLKWNSVQRGIQGCRFWIKQLFSQIPSLKYLFWANLFPKLQSTLLRMKLGMKEYSGLLILNSRIYFSISVFYGKFGPEISKFFVWNETRYKRVFGGADFEISNCFLGKLWYRNFKVLCFKRNPVQWDIQECKFWIQFFYTLFFFFFDKQH